MEDCKHGATTLCISILVLVSMTRLQIVRASTWLDLGQTFSDCPPPMRDPTQCQPEIIIPTVFHWRSGKITKLGLRLKHQVLKMLNDVNRWGFTTKLWLKFLQCQEPAMIAFNTISLCDVFILHKKTKRLKGCLPCVCNLATPPGMVHKTIKQPLDDHLSWRKVQDTLHLLLFGTILSDNIYNPFEVMQYPICNIHGFSRGTSSHQN